MMGSILGDLMGLFISLLGRTMFLNEFDGDYFYNAIKTIRTVSPEELQQLAKKYLNPEEFYELVVV
jgi:predicted Zn-dependent peptidase